MARGRSVSQGQPELTGRPVKVPADPSSAAFPGGRGAAGARFRHHRHRRRHQPAALPDCFETLTEMGADIAFANARDRGRRAGGRPGGARHGSLQGVDVPAERAPSMIDEYPILAVAAAFARGTTRMRGLAELRVKESDRLAAVAERAAGVRRPPRGRGRRPDRAWRRPPAGRRGDHRRPSRSSHRHVLPGLGHGRRASRCGSTTAAPSKPASPASPP